MVGGAYGARHASSQSLRTDMEYLFSARLVGLGGAAGMFAVLGKLQSPLQMIFDFRQGLAGESLARRLAVIMHRMWVDGTEFRWAREVARACYLGLEGWLESRYYSRFFRGDLLGNSVNEAQARALPESFFDVPDLLRAARRIGE